MKKKYFLATFLIVLTLSLLVVLLFDNEDNSNNIKMDSNDTKVSQNQFAIMINNGEGEYIESDSNVFPTNMAFNASATVCTDKDGNKLEDVISFENGKVTVETNKKMYCYLYFDDYLSNYLFDNLPLGLNTTLEGGLYRFQGTNDTVNNHICFGTTNKEDCLNDTDKYMYRIIGINENEQLKLIKKEALNSGMQWMNSDPNQKKWPDSTIKANINGSSFLTNTTYMPSDWNEKIATTTWKYGDNSIYNTTAVNLYTTENNWSTTISAKIGLMYAHDYYYAYQSNGLNCSYAGGNYSTCKTSWLHLSQNDSGSPHINEWTMGRHDGDAYGSFKPWCVTTNGNVSEATPTLWYSARPVFYLIKEVAYISGTGTSIDPFIIQ